VLSMDHQCGKSRRWDVMREDGWYDARRREKKVGPVALRPVIRSGRLNRGRPVLERRLLDAYDRTGNLPPDLHAFARWLHEVASASNHRTLVFRYVEVLRSRPKQRLQPISLLPASKDEIKCALVGLSRRISGQFPRDIVAEGELREGYSCLAFFLDDRLARREAAIRRDKEELRKWCRRFEKGEITETELPKLGVTRPSQFTDVVVATQKATEDFIALGLEFDRLTGTGATPWPSSTPGHVPRGPEPRQGMDGSVPGAPRSD
jgi:hypothetical protein